MPSEFEIFVDVFGRLIEKMGAEKAEEAARLAKTSADIAFKVYMKEEKKQEEKKPG